MTDSHKHYAGEGTIETLVLHLPDLDKDRMELRLEIGTLETNNQEISGVIMSLQETSEALLTRAENTDQTETLGKETDTNATNSGINYHCIEINHLGPEIIPFVMAMDETVELVECHSRQGVLSVETAVLVRFIENPVETESSMMHPIQISFLCHKWFQVAVSMG